MHSTPIYQVVIKKNRNLVLRKIKIRFNLIKIRSLIAPGFAMPRITKPGAIKDRILIRLAIFNTRTSLTGL